MRLHGLTTSRRVGLALASSAALALSALTPGPLEAQYFGRNKVVYRNFDFREMHTQHFDIFYYPAESAATADAARMAERWYVRHAEALRDTFARKPIILYSDPPAFAQTNVIPGFIGVGIGGVTEPSRSRAILPFSGDYASDDHVLGHELVHVFQFDIAGAMRGGFTNMNRMPQWAIEGMAEYLSIGRDDPNTAMWMRDAALRDVLPTFKKLATDPRYFPYRYGQALWAYIGGRYGDVEIPAIYRSALRRGIEPAIREVIGISPDSLVKDWQAAIKATYLADAESRTRPELLGTRLLKPTSKKYPDQDVSPEVSPDGQEVAFITARGLFQEDLYVADANTGKIVRKLTSPNGNQHFDALNFINSSGSWSPDGTHFVVAAYAQGATDIVIYDVHHSRLDKTIRIHGLGDISDISWGPNDQLVFSGMANGFSNLYLYDLRTEKTRQLTQGRWGRLQPSWSPDGHTIAYVTDSAPATNFDLLTYSPMQIALLDLPTNTTRLLPLFGGHAKHINPVFRGDGESLYFVSDPDGVPDIYRLWLATGQIERITRVATGVSGITSLSPTLSISAKTGRLMFSLFERGGYTIHRLDPELFPSVTLVTRDSVGPNAQGVLVPPDAPAGNTVTERIADPATGLPPQHEFPTGPYHPDFALDGIGTAGVGVAFGGPAGTGAAGGVAFQFGDNLENNILAATVQASGYVQDIGGQALYINQSHRWNYGVTVGHIPYLQLGTFAFDTTVTNPDNSTSRATIVEQEYLRTYYEQGQLFAQYPFSETRRVEFGAGFTYLHYGLRADRYLLFPDGSAFLLAQNQGLPVPPGLNLFQGSVAYVGDYSNFGFTSPVAGGRYRFEADPTFGSLHFTTALADYRRYFLVNPVTFAFRLFHYGRYGGGSEDRRLSPLYLGDPYFIRGYDVNSFSASECSALFVGSTGSCPSFDRLLGSRLAVMNAELRIPLLGVSQFGLINFPYLPTEISPFIDGGLAWRNNSNVVLTFNKNDPRTIPVFSAGVSARVNVLGYIVAEIYYAHPFQRPGKGGQFGFQILPGW